MRIAALATCMFLGLSSLQAQDLASLRHGERIRIHATPPAPGQIIGTLTATEPAHLTIRTAAGSVTVPRQHIQTVERSMRRSRRRTGALIGGCVGVAAAAILALTDEQEPFLFSDSPPLATRGELFLGGTLVFAPIGAGLGALLAPGERWVAVSVPRAASGDARPTRHVQVGLSFGFPD